jgi:A/G-specific adenine glycosylase
MAPSMIYDSSYDDASIVRDFQKRYGLYKRRRPVQKPLPDAAVREFREIIYGYYKNYGRDLPWRRTDDPYHILVSEVMLQQTRVGRVSIKFQEFLRAFPTIEALASTSLRDVLAVWQGMGYNRRARYLHDLAAQIKDSGEERIPGSPDELARLPGIGWNTAAAVCAFAFNLPVAFIETNIRAVFIYFFFHGRDAVHDREILSFVEATLDRKDPRRWYSALMDYGAMLKMRRGNPTRGSAHYKKQPPFKGSRRQVRGKILAALIANGGMTLKQLAKAVDMPEDITTPIAEKLVGEGLVVKKGRVLLIPS